MGYHSPKRPRLRKPYLNPSNGALQVCLWHDNRMSIAYVHRLVATAFFSSPDYRNLQVNHKDGNRTNNQLENLEFVTPKENCIHARDVLGKKPGKPSFGEQNGMAAMTDTDAANILILAAAGRATGAIARSLRIPYKRVWRVLRGESWKHIPRL